LLKYFEKQFSRRDLQICRDSVGIGFELVEYWTQAHNICVITSQKSDSIFKEGLLLKECNMYITDTEA